ncbi:Virginiamycin B lyase [Maioricimonas rarisocia]|uniref:Virginiamycin B lyase n=1 Tax=Maioricimonas rarisocia TaxID=2528026 RepID=A0A517ZEE9_9PLAN|nr:hypothetical protein [Maioricimonas rarisocia]QDU40865.1 Virginiamycin B lyase [Maioricimonas rarisocia]
MKNPLSAVMRSALLLAAIGALCPPSSANAATRITGRVQLGGTEQVQPLAGVPVTLFEATEGTPIHVGRAVTDQDGNFRIQASKQSTESIFFLTASVTRGVTFVTILGPTLPAQATINELTSVAASYSMAQFARKGYISGTPFRLRIAAMMNNNIVSVATGESSSVLMTSPNADESHSLRLTRSLANLLNAAVQNAWIRYVFLMATAPADSLGTPSPDTALGMANLARDPGRLANLIYLLSQSGTAYGPALTQEPDAWTVTVKVNDSGDDNYMFGGPANVSFDSRGYAWIANNVVQGTPYSANRIMVLKPDGTPADGSDGRPVSPVTGGGIYGVGWGITVDRTDTVWIGNFGWGGDDYNPTVDPFVSLDPLVLGNGSVSKFTVAGQSLSDPIGFFGGTYRAQAIKVDQQGNVWIASLGNDRVVVFPEGDHTRAKHLQFYEGAGTFGIAVAPDGGVWVSNSGGLAGKNPSSVAKVRLDSNGEVKLEHFHHVGDTLKVIDVDSQGNAWVASQGDSTIYGFRSNGQPIGAFSGGGVYGPWGLCIDGEDNVWVGNFGPLEVGSNATNNGVSNLCGANRQTWPLGKFLGQPISPSTGYTVHSAGSQVLLHDGTPLYGTGPGAEPSFAPLMRQTSVQIDQAGNLWAFNNWKPRFNTDVGLFNDGTIVVDPDDANPGGDGIVIFVGLAPPPKSQFTP